jgi:hypothetical protein
METVRKVDVKERRIRMMGKEERQGNRRQEERNVSERAKAVPDLTEI